MLEFIILGLIPGTDIQVGFLPILLALLTILCGVEVVLRVRRTKTGQQNAADNSFELAV